MTIRSKRMGPCRRLSVTTKQASRQFRSDLRQEYNHGSSLRPAHHPGRPQIRQSGALPERFRRRFHTMEPDRKRGARALDALSVAIATAGGVGYAPVAPGTFGTAVAVPLAWIVAGAPQW